MTYRVGIDLGTTFSYAATVRSLGSRDRIVDIVSVPSLVAIRPDGSLVSGEAAATIAETNPSSAVREFKRRLGDPTPYRVAGAGFEAKHLLGEQLAALVRLVASRVRASPADVVLTYPTSWGSHRLKAFAEATASAGVHEPLLITEAEAVARHFAMADAVPQGKTVLVYDLGGTSFSAAAVHIRADGVELLARQIGVEDLGGCDIDDVVLSLVDEHLAGAFSKLDPSAVATASVIQLARARCRQAKEALSEQERVWIDVELPSAQHRYRLERAEFERRIGPIVSRTVERAQEVLAAAGLDAQDISAVLLAGGSAQIPLIHRVLTSWLGPVSRYADHPEHLVALGAARTSRRRVGPGDPGNGGRRSGAPRRNEHNPR